MRLRLASAVSLLLAVVLGVGVMVAAGGRDRATASSPSAVQPVPPVTLLVAGQVGDHIPYDKPLQLRVSEGSLRAVTLTRDDGQDAPGRGDAAGTGWASAATLTPTAGYQLVVAAVDLAGRPWSQSLSLIAADSPKHLTATLSPGDGQVVGVGQPVVVYFNRSVAKGDRDTVTGRIAVTASPAAAGRWKWANAQEVHWVPTAYWPAQTTITVASDLRRLALADGVVGAGSHTARFGVGSAQVSTVDVAAHTMTVRRDGQVLKVLPISAGRDKYPTMGGVHIAMTREPKHHMNSATVGIPVNSPDGYDEDVFWNVRISDSGGFVHAAPWSVASQGRTNVSHGCVNLAPADAQWFMQITQLGDVIDVVNSPRGPDPGDHGTFDWN